MLEPHNVAGPNAEPDAPAPQSDRPAERPRINVYTCSAGHRTVTVDLVKGTTPFMIGCVEGGRLCNRDAMSSCYQVDQSLVPTHEWYKPTPRQAKRLHPAEEEHVSRGGLLLRRIPKTDA